MNPWSAQNASFSVSNTDTSIRPREGAPDGQCEWRSPNGIPKPLVVQIQATWDGLPVRRYAQSSLQNVGNPDQMGWVRIAYGAGAARQEIEVDLMGSSIAIPPSDYCRVTARQFTPFGANDGTQIDASITEGVLTGDPIAPTNTVLRFNTTIGGGTDFLNPVSKARWMQLSPIFDPSLVSDDLVLACNSGQIQCGTPLSNQYPAHAFWPVPYDDGTFEVVYNRTASGSADYLVQFFIVP